MRSNFFNCYHGNATWRRFPPFTDLGKRKQDEKRNVEFHCLVWGQQLNWLLLAEKLILGSPTATAIFFLCLIRIAGAVVIFPHVFSLICKVPPKKRAHIYPSHSIGGGPEVTLAWGAGQWPECERGWKFMSKHIWSHHNLDVLCVYHCWSFLILRLHEERNYEFVFLWIVFWKCLELDDSVEAIL